MHILFSVGKLSQSANMGQNAQEKQHKKVKATFGRPSLGAHVDPGLVRVLDITQQDRPDLATAGHTASNGAQNNCKN